MTTTTTSVDLGPIFWISTAIGFIVWIGLIWATVHIAGTKGRSKFGWGVFAFFFSLLALIIVAVLGPNPKANPTMPPTTV